MRIVNEDMTIVEKIAYCEKVIELVSFYEGNEWYRNYDICENVTETDEGLSFEIYFDNRQNDFPDMVMTPKRITFSFDMDELKSFNSHNQLTRFNDIFGSYIEKLKTELNDLIGTGYEDFQTMIWYNGLAPVILSWKQLPHDKGIIKCPDKYNGSHEDGDKWGQYQFIWGTAVYKFGSYGTSPRYGWIEDEHPEFYDWIEAICYDSILESIHITTKVNNDYWRMIKDE